MKKQTKSEKSRMVAFLLSSFFGAFGIHQFYVGNTKRGIIMLILAFTFVLMIIPAVMNFIDWIKLLMGTFEDAEGLKVTDW